MEKEKQENILDKMGISFHRKLSFKLVTIGILILLLLIPKIMILSLINERSINANSAIQEVMSKWSEEQVITGPILTIPYKKRVYNKADEAYQDLIEIATFLPKTLHVKGEMRPEKLYRSIYDVIVYESDLKLEGSFETPNFETLDILPENVLWDQAQIQLAISDLRGINEEVKLDWSGKELTFSPGLKKSSIGNSGISLTLPKNKASNNNTFKLDLGIKGSKSLQFTPVGEKTEVHISSSWNDPGFTGNFLPKDRNISKTGFEADWRILHFNRNFPQQWLNKTYDAEIHGSDFGVELVSLANHYQKNTRSAKYGILIILVTFIIFFMYEVFSKQRIHSFQYILVGCAITLFYLLLLSISEHLGFNKAYLIASCAIVFLVFLYSRSFMPKLKNSFGVGTALAACFGFIFILLQLESYALLAGSVGLFILLAILMYFTRKVNWYNE
jgi:inner membrane protein